MVIAIRLELEAVDCTADCPAAIDQAKAPRKVDAGERRSPLALPRLKRELQEGNLYPVIGCNGQQARDEKQGQSGDDRDTGAATGRLGDPRTAVEETPERIAGAAGGSDHGLGVLDESLEELALPGAVQLVGLRMHRPEIRAVTRLQPVTAHQRVGLARGDLRGLRFVGIQRYQAFSR